MVSFFIGLLILFFSGIFSCFIKRNLKTKFISIASGISSIFCLIPAIKTLLSGEILTKTIEFNQIFGEVNFVIDPLSAFFIIIISIMCLIGVIYSNGYLKPYIEKGKSINAHLLFLTMLIASMLLVVTCQNALMFLICWEIMSLSSFFLVIFENEKKEVLKAGLKYLVFMHVSVLFIIIAFAMSAISSGSLDFNEISDVISMNSHLANIIFLLSFIGFGIKAGFVPFHNWLPEAHPAAPSHVSGMMSGVMIKTGIYGILRMLLLIQIPSKMLAYIALTIAIISGLYGILYATNQRDIKKLLAYSSIENIGIIGIGIGLGMLGLAYNNMPLAFLGFAGGILHILNHSIFKELLFLGAGSVYLKTHTKNIEELGGLIKSMPKTAILCIIGATAICALPPFNGFISEFLIYFGMIKGILTNNSVLALMCLTTLASLALIGTMAILCFSKAISIMFLGTERTEYAKKVKNDVENCMVIPMLILSIFALLIGLFPQFAINLILNPVELFTNDNFEISNLAISIMQQISIAMSIFVIVTLLLICIKCKLQKGKISIFETWGCGYNKPNERMQYTASSYVKPFIYVLRPLFKKVFDVVKPKKLFPKEAHYNSNIDDIEEAYFINPLIKFDELFLSKFEKLQGGNLQTYIQYSLAFLVIILIGCIFIN